jgi:hypothetical protein
MFSEIVVVGQGQSPDVPGTSPRQRLAKGLSSPRKAPAPAQPQWCEGGQTLVGEGICALRCPYRKRVQSWCDMALPSTRPGYGTVLIPVCTHRTMRNTDLNHMAVCSRKELSVVETAGRQNTLARWPHQLDGSENLVVFLTELVDQTHRASTCTAPSTTSLRTNPRTSVSSLEAHHASTGLWPLLSARSDDRPHPGRRAQNVGHDRLG